MKTPPENDFYGGFVRHVAILTGIVGGVGALVAGVLRGPRFGAGILLGAALSALSFWRWKKLADALAPGTPKRSGSFWILRLAALVGIAYVIVKYLAVTAMAVFLGLLASAAATIIAAIYELLPWNMKSGSPR